MNTSDRFEVLSDALKECGFERVTVWHLKCLESMLTGSGENFAISTYRLRCDTKFESLDKLHAAVVGELWSGKWGWKRGGV